MHKTRRVNSQDLKAGFGHDERIAREERFHGVADRANANAKWLDETMQEAHQLVSDWNGYAHDMRVVVELSVRIEKRA